jgi:hypothetical protein
MATGSVHNYPSISALNQNEHKNFQPLILIFAKPKNNPELDFRIL